MTRRDLEHFQRELLETRQALVREIRLLMESNLDAKVSGAAHDRSAQPLHPAELANHTHEMDLGAELIEKKESLVRSVDEALTRIAEGTFGTCESCDKTIEPGRLRALPQARLCLGCQQESERGYTF